MRTAIEMRMGRGIGTEGPGWEPSGLAAGVLEITSVTETAKGGVRPKEGAGREGKSSPRAPEAAGRPKGIAAGGTEESSN